MKPAIPFEKQPLPFVGFHKVLRALVWICVALIICVVAQSFTITRLLPLKEKEIHFVEFQSGGNNFVRVIKAGQDITQFQNLVSVTMRQYVVNHETVSQAHGEQTTDYLFRTSSELVYSQYKEQYRGFFETADFKREVEIISDTALSPTQHSVKFKVTDIRGSQKRSFTASAYIRYRFKDTAKMPFDERFINPTGLYVEAYQIGREG